MKRIKTADIILHILIIITTVWAVGCYFFTAQSGTGTAGTQCFRFFTTDSNVLACVGSMIYLVYMLVNRNKPDFKMPRWIVVFKFAGTVAVTVTLLTVIFFLAPTAALASGKFSTVFLYFMGNAFVLHFSTPVLSIATLFLEKHEPVTKKQALFGVMPTLVYGIVYVLLVVVLGVWYDWYGFTFGGRNEIVPVSLLVMLLFTLGLAMLERRFKKKK